MQQIKEIWYIDQYVGHPQYGNVYRNFYMARELVKKGYKVKIFAASYSHLMYHSPQISGMITSEVIDGVEFNWIKVRRYRSGKGLRRIFSIFEFTSKIRRLKKNLPPPDLIITPSVPFIPYWSIRYLQKSVWKEYNVKLILEIRDLWPLTFTTVGKVNKNNPFIKLLSITENHAFRNVDYIISTLKMCTDYIDTRIETPYRFKWIDNGIDVDPPNNVRLPDEIERLLPKNKFIVGYTGTLGAANSVGFLVDAARILSEHNGIHFLIVGDGYEKENLVRQAYGLNNITFIPRVKKLMVPELLKRCDILHFSYLNAPDLYRFGVSANKTYEYMLSGKPIILSCPQMDYNIIAAANCGKVIPPEDPKAIAETIKEFFLMTEQQREQMGINGREFILGNNTFDILSDKLIDVINELEFST